jgi:hypothetical protein
MTPIEFSQFHNRHIRFRLRNRSEELTGVVLLDHNNQTGVEYIFIPTNRMIEWKTADREGNLQVRSQIESRGIDISEIEWAEILN